MKRYTKKSTQWKYGFVEKMGESPVLYSITEKGKEFIIED